MIFKVWREPKHELHHQVQTLQSSAAAFMKARNIDWDAMIRIGTFSGRAGVKSAVKWKESPLAANGRAEAAQLQEQMMSEFAEELRSDPALAS